MATELLESRERKKQWCRIRRGRDHCPRNLFVNMIKLFINVYKELTFMSNSYKIFSNVCKRN